MQQQWVDDGLGYFVAKLRRAIGDLAAGTFVGVGGCAHEPHSEWWNLYYRFRPECHGLGLATELGLAALAAAHAEQPSMPVVASLAEENRASRATTERIGLTLQWRGAHRNGDETVHLVYADRMLSADHISELSS